MARTASGSSDAATRPRPGLATVLLRGLTGRCPRCGSGGIRKGFALAERCPRCELRFDREEGFRAGALGVNTIVTFAVLAVVVGGGIAATAPDIPVLPFAAVALAIAVLLPVVFYPLSLTTWAALDVWLRPPGEGRDRYDERERRVASSHLAERLAPSLDEIVAAWRDAGAGDLGALRRAFDGRGPAATSMRAGDPAFRFGSEAAVAHHELVAEGIDGWRVRLLVDGVDGRPDPTELAAVLRWSPADQRWFAWSLDPAPVA